MNKYKTLIIADFHLTDRKYKNKDLEDFEEEAQKEAWNKILGIIDEYKVNKLILNGDIFDAPPVGTSLELFHNFMLSLKEKDLEIIMISGNHCLIEGLREKKYYPNLMKVKWKDNYNINVLEYDEVEGKLFAGHGSINKLEKLNKKYDLVFSHFRSGITGIASNEIDVSLLNHKVGLVVLGDIHTRLSYDNIVYTGSPIDTSFGSSNELPEHTPSVLLLNEETLEWEWKNTLTTSYRKYKRVYPSVKKFLEDVGNLEQDAISNNNFYKIVIQDKRHNLKALDTSLYKHFAIIETSITDLLAEKQNNEVAKKVVESLSSKDISSNLLDFILKNNDRIELVDNIKMAYHSYDVAALKEINDKA